jgi:ketosteroid isomerase-like protein
VSDAIEAYRRATEANDMGAVAAVLTPDVELVSPLSGRMTFRGRDDVGKLLTAVYGTLRDLRWTSTIGDGDQRVVYGG